MSESRQQRRAGERAERKGAEAGQQPTGATMFVTLADSGEAPTASSAGYDTSEVIPPAVPTTPAIAPAASRMPASTTDIMTPKPAKDARTLA